MLAELERVTDLDWLRAERTWAREEIGRADTLNLSAAEMTRLRERAYWLDIRVQQLESMPSGV
jgi:hypothetical protein